MQVVSCVTVDPGAFPGTTEWGGIIMNNNNLGGTP